MSHGPTNPAEQYFNKGLWGWAGSAWRKLALVFGYTSGLHEEQSLTSAAGGNEMLSFTTVPSGELWVVTGWTAFSVTGNPGQVRALINTGSGQKQYWRSATVVAQEAIAFPCPVYCPAGTEIKTQYRTCTAGDVIFSNIVGYKMEVN